jgi:hypothetical protein
VPLTLDEGLLAGEFDLGGGIHTDFTVSSIESSKYTETFVETRRRLSSMFKLQHNRSFLWQIHYQQDNTNRSTRRRGRPARS